MQDKMSIKFTSHPVSMEMIHDQFKNYLRQYVDTNVGNGSNDAGYYTISGWIEALRWSGIIDNAQYKVFESVLNSAKTFVLTHYRLYGQLSSSVSAKESSNEEEDES